MALSDSRCEVPRRGTPLHPPGCGGFRCRPSATRRARGRSEGWSDSLAPEHQFTAGVTVDVTDHTVWPSTMKAEYVTVMSFSSVCQVNTWISRPSWMVVQPSARRPNRAPRRCARRRCAPARPWPAHTALSQGRRSGWWPRPPSWRSGRSQTPAGTL